MKKTLWASLFAAPIFLLAACSESASQSSASEESAAANSTVVASETTTSPSGEHYVVISQMSYPPFATKSEKGEMAGLDMDLLNAIAKKQGFTLEFKPHGMTGLLQNLDTGEADIIATGVNISPEREQLYTFSKPYMEASWVVLLDKNKSKETTFEALKDKPIAVQQDSLSQKQLAGTGITNNIVPEETVYFGIKAIAADRAVGVYDVDSVLNTYLAQPNSTFYTVVDEKSGKIPFGWVMKKGNLALKEKLDKGLDDLKADGTYDQIVKKWYGNK